MLDKHKQLIKDLKEKTLSGTVKWGPSPDATDQFALLLKKGVILLDKDFDAFNFDPRAQKYDLAFTILNNEGKQIDRIRVTRSDEEFDDIDNLFTTIQRRVLKIDEQIDELIAELDTLGNKH